MLTALVIVFRETLEMFLVIFPLLAYVNKINRRYLSKYIYSGAVLGALSSIGLGSFLFLQAKNLDGFSQQLFQGSMMLFLSGLILYNIVQFGKQSKQYTFENENNYKSIISAFSLFLIAFITIFRESLEIIIFLLPLINSSPIIIISSIFSGALISFILVFIAYKFTLKLNLSIIFNVLTIMLIFIGSVMFGEGIAIIFPSLGKSFETFGKMVYSIPLLYIFAKKELKRILKKK